MATWRTILRQFDLQNDPFKVISLFKSMQKMKQNNPVNDPFVFASLVKACCSLLDVNGGKSVHGRTIRLGLDACVNVSNSLIYFYISTKRFMSYACILFDRIPERNVVTVNCMVSGFIKNGQLNAGLSLFSKFLGGEFGSILMPNYVTLMVLISGCVENGGHKVGKLLHSYCCKTGLDLIIEVCNALMDFYAKFGNMDDAARLLNTMTERQLVSWNTMIAGYARSNKWRKAFSLFREMRDGNIGYDSVSLVTLILACANGGHIDTGKMTHGYIVASGEEITVSLRTVIINMYSKCGLLNFAKKVFDEPPDRSIASWNSMIYGYVENGHNNEASRLFKLIKCRKVESDEVTMLGLISACRNSGELSHGIDIYSYIESSQLLKGSTALQNALIDMFAKCGDISRARTVFDGISNKDVISWTSIIVGYAINGEGKQALLAFQQMCANKIVPNSVTFIGVLSACDHSGLIDIGQNLYDIMSNVYHIEPKIEHCGCMVDMLARAGKLKEAIKFIKRMPVKTNAVVWRMLINACRVHGNVDLGLRLVSSLIERNKTPNAEDHVVSSNIYAEAGRWNDVLRARRMMVAQESSKMAGTSSISDIT